MKATLNFYGTERSGKNEASNLEAHFTKEEVFGASKEIKENKAVGLDGYTNSLLLEFQLELSQRSGNEFLGGFREITDL